MNNRSIPCEVSLENWKTLARFRNLWTIWLLILGGALVLFILAAIFLFIRQTWLPGAVSTVATIFDGLFVKWIVERRKDAVDEEGKAREDVNKHCAVKAKGYGLMAPKLPKDIEDEMEAFQQRQKIFFKSIR